METPEPIEMWDGGKWDVTKKNHALYQRFVINLPDVNKYYQLLFECSSDTKMSLYSMDKNRHGIS